MINALTNNTLIMEKALDGSWAKNDVISNNLANIETPDYKRQDVEFQKLLKDAMDSTKFKGYATNERHIQIGKMDVTRVTAKTHVDANANAMRYDGNTVDVDIENVELAKNTIYYNAVIGQINKQLKMILSSIKETK